MGKDIVVITAVLIVIALVTLVACLKVASDDDDRNGRD